VLMGKEMAKQDICMELFSKYVVDDQTPSHLVSSHWRKMYQAMSLNDEAEVKTIRGLGFGQMDRLNLPAKVFSWMTILMYMLSLQDRMVLFRIMVIARKVAARMGLDFSYDCFRQVCSLQLIGKYSSLGRGRGTCLVIGDGYGFLSCLLKDVYPDCRVILIDLGKTLLFQARHCQNAFPSARHLLVDFNNDCNIEDADFVYCPAEKIDSIRTFIHVCWAINIASMQEMNKGTVESYFSFLRDVLVQDNLFYCCNRKEKIMHGGEVSRFYEYPWNPMDKNFIDGACPWHKFFLSHRRAKHGPTFFGIRVPFVNYFNGQHFHRLSRLAIK